MKIAKTLTLAAAIAMGLGCGYSKSNTPPQPGTMPAITQLNPASQVSGGAAFPLEVDGANFAANAVINFNGAKQVPTTVSATKLTAMIPASAIMNAGTVPVTVTNPGTPGGPYGGGTLPETSTAMSFTIN
jgi:hypothetical protein